MNESLSEREQVVEVINRLFYYTDYQIWDKLITDVFDHQVEMDMISLGAPKVETLTPREICSTWENGFKGLDAIHHQAGNYMISFSEKSAEVKAYAVASHYKKEITGEQVREFIGDYDFHLNKTVNGWRIDKFKFNLKYMKGNLELN